MLCKKEINLKILSPQIDQSLKFYLKTFSITEVLNPIEFINNTLQETIK